MKTCTRCKKEKSVKEFNVNRNAKDGLQVWCRECAREYGKNRQQRRKRSRSMKKAWEARKANGKMVPADENQKVRDTKGFHAIAILDGRTGSMVTVNAKWIDVMGKRVLLTG